MKIYIVYNAQGYEIGLIKAGSHNAAEKKARKKFEGQKVSVAYTEL
jgi:hypothetical protein